MLRSTAIWFLLLVPGSLSLAQVPGQQSATARMPDGGVRETLESIVITPIPNAPFTLTLQTEWMRYMGNGGTFTVANRRKIARDSRGRIYEERWALVPKSGRVKSFITAIQIADPIRHTLDTCMMDNRHVCHVSYYSDSTVLPRQVRENRTINLPNDEGTVAHEDLGQDSTEGIDTVGTRITTTYNAGVMGNDSQFIIEREFWYSPRLGINLISKISDPRFGTQTFTATDVQPSEPDPSLFQLPKGFTAVDERGASPPSRNSVAPPAARLGAPSN